MQPRQHDIDTRPGRGTEEVAGILPACLGEEGGGGFLQGLAIMVICVEQISDSHPTH